MPDGAEFEVTAVGFGYVLLASYWTVLVAELIGDKSIYTIASLSLRFRAALVFLGMMVAFGGKMFVAVMLGQSLAQIPVRWTMAASAVIFFSTAIFIWFKKPKRVEALDSKRTSWPQATLIPFASLFLTEWGDAGQMSAAAMTAQSKLPLAVWFGSTLALLTKGALAMALGLTLRDRIPEKTLRRLAASSCFALGLFTLCQAILT